MANLHHSNGITAPMGSATDLQQHCSQIGPLKVSDRHDALAQVAQHSAQQRWAGEDCGCRFTPKDQHFLICSMSLTGQALLVSSLPASTVSVDAATANAHIMCCDQLLAACRTGTRADQRVQPLLVVHARHLPVVNTLSTCLLQACQQLLPSIATQTKLYLRHSGW